MDTITNSDRAERAATLMRNEYASFESIPDTLTDLLADLIHLCDREGLSFAERVKVATYHYWAEYEAELPHA